MRKFVLGLALLTAGCASSGPDYLGNPQAVAQAQAQCRVGSDGVAASSMGQGAFFAVAMQQQYMNDCMLAKGFPRP